MTRIIISGARDWNDRILADNLVRRLRRRYGQDLTVITGGASGIDAAVANACRRYGVRQEVYAARWNDLKAPGARIRQDASGRHYNAQAGPDRNAAMLSSGCDFVVACHRNLRYSSGTRDCVQQALSRGIKVFLIDHRNAEPHRIQSISDARRPKPVEV